MGIDASYVIPYKRGLLKKIQEEIRERKHYFCDNKKLLYAFTRCGEIKDMKAKEQYITFEIEIVSDSTYSSTSMIFFYPHIGVLEIYDGYRYFGKRNEKYNNKVIKYYENLLKTMGHIIEYCEIHSDCFPDVDERTMFHPEADRLTNEEVLQEIPFDLLSKREREMLTELLNIPERSTEK